MEFYAELNELLANTQKSEQAVRKQAEADIKRLRDENPKKFLATLTKEVADEGNNESVRMLAAVIFKNFVANRGGDSRYQDYWVGLDGVFKSNIKEAMLANLASPSNILRSQVANAIATIAKIEIPRREWLELIPNLCTNAGHENLDFKNAALQTLGYICEELKPDDINDQLKNTIILALTSNISKREYIVNKLFEAFNIDDEDIRIIAMQTLVEIAREEYDSVEFFFEQVTQITAAAARGEDEKLGAQAIEFWTSLAEEESRRMRKGGNAKGYINQQCQALIQLLIECIQRVAIEDENEEDDELGVATASGCCLAAVALVIGNIIMQPVIHFVSQNVQSPEWKKRYSALIALGAITEGPEKMKYIEVILPGLPNLVSMFQDPNAKVREVIAWVMSKICEHHSEVFTQDRQTLICRAIEYLAVSTSAQNDNPLSPYFSTLFQILITNAYRVDGDHTQVDLTLASFSALTALSENAGDEVNDQMYAMLLPVLQLLEKTITSDVAQYGEKRAKDIQDYLNGLLQIILVKVGHKLDDQTAGNIVKLLIMIFQSLKKVTENGLIALSGLINGFGERLNVNEFGLYIVWALQGDDDECVRLACGLVSDLAGALRENISRYLSDFVPHLLKILRDQNQDRKSKLHAIIALGDLSMNSGEIFSQQYLPDVLKLLESAAQQSLTIAGQVDDDYELAGYLVQLRETLVECYTSIVHGVTEAPTKSTLVKFAPNILAHQQISRFKFKIQSAAVETNRGQQNNFQQFDDFQSLRGVCLTEILPLRIQLYKSRVLQSLNVALPLKELSLQ